jgi:hypothetical protein
MEKTNKDINMDINANANMKTNANVGAGTNEEEHTDPPNPETVEQSASETAKFGVVSIKVENMKIERHMVSYERIILDFTSNERKGVVKIRQVSTPEAKIIKDFEAGDVKSFSLLVEIKDWEAMEPSYIARPLFEYWFEKFNATYIGEIKILWWPDSGVLTCDGRVKFRDDQP